MPKKLGIVALILGIMILTAEVALADFEVYLMIEGVSGKSKVNSHETDWSDIIGMVHPSHIESGAAGSRSARTGKVEFNDFSIVKELDKATPKLADKVASGEVIPKVTLELRRAGGDKQVFLKITMTEVKIVGIRSAGTSGRAKLEKVTFKYKTLIWERVS